MISITMITITSSPSPPAPNDHHINVTTSMSSPR